MTCDKKHKVLNAEVAVSLDKFIFYMLVHISNELLGFKRISKNKLKKQLLLI